MTQATDKSLDEVYTFTPEMQFAAYWIASFQEQDRRHQVNNDLDSKTYAHLASDNNKSEMEYFETQVSNRRIDIYKTISQLSPEMFAKFRQCSSVNEMVKFYRSEIEKN